MAKTNFSEDLIKYGSQLKHIGESCRKSDEKQQKALTYLTANYPEAFAVSG